MKRFRSSLIGIAGYVAIVVSTVAVYYAALQLPPAPYAGLALAGVYIAWKSGLLRRR